jgi:phage gp36-like protein
MPYSAYADLKTIEPDAQLIQLSNDTAGASEVDLTNINGAISCADGVIDSYLRGHVDLPLDTPYPTIIVDLSVELAICHLYKRRFGSNMPESMTNREKEAVKTLLLIAAGKLLLTAKEQDEKPEANVQVKTRPKMFPQQAMDKY